MGIAEGFEELRRFVGNRLDEVGPEELGIDRTNELQEKHLAELQDEVEELKRALAVRVASDEWNKQQIAAYQFGGLPLKLNEIRDELTTHDKGEEAVKDGG